MLLLCNTDESQELYDHHVRRYLYFASLALYNQFFYIHMLFLDPSESDICAHPDCLDLQWEMMVTLGTFL